MLPSVPPHKPGYEEPAENRGMSWAPKSDMHPPNNENKGMFYLKDPIMNPRKSP